MAISATWRAPFAKVRSAATLASTGRLRTTRTTFASSPRPASISSARSRTRCSMRSSSIVCAPRASRCLRCALARTLRCAGAQRVSRWRRQLAHLAAWGSPVGRCSCHCARPHTPAEVWAQPMAPSLLHLGAWKWPSSQQSQTIPTLLKTPSRVPDAQKGLQPTCDMCTLPSKDKEDFMHASSL